MSSEFDDVELVREIVAGDHAAAAVFVDRFSGLVYAVLMRDVGLPQERAEDVYQSVFLRLWENNYRALRLWECKGSLAAYVATIARHLAYDHLRLNPKPPAPPPGNDDPPPDPPQDDPDALDEIIAQCDRATVRKALGMLSDRDRELLARRHTQDQSYREIATAMGLSVNNVGVALYRAERRLRDLLREEFPGLFGDAKSPPPVIPRREDPSVKQ